VKGQKMKVRDLQGHIYDKLYLYTNSDSTWDEFVDLYKGDFANIPAEYLDWEVRVIGAKRRGILDISVVPQ
jgi:hypothetical protein